MRVLIAAGILAIVGGVGFAMFWPVVSAKNAYNVAEATFDYSAKCDAATELADAWAHLGFTERAREWKRLAYHICLFAHPDRL